MSAWARAEIEIGAILDLVGFQPTLNSASGEDTESSLEPGKAGRVKCELASMATWPGAEFGTMEMLKPLLPVAFLATIIASPVVADQTLIAPAFGNTILSTYPDGRTGELWLKPDGSYTAMGRRKDQSNGHWKVHDQKLCLKQAHPFAPPISFCTPIPSGGVSAAWTAKALSGEPIKITLVKGHATGAAGAQAQ